MRLRIMLLALVAVVVLPCAAQAASFTTPFKLTGASGGEPSIATDPFGHVYVSGPQGIPAGANGTIGVGFWVSGNDGDSFPPAQLIGSSLGGGDSDVIYSPHEKAVYVADLEAAAAQICKSTKFGAPGSFTGIGPTPDPSNCTQTNGGQAGASDDREWLTAAPDGTLYLTYHEFVSAQPVAFRSDNGGTDDFANPCGPLVTDPSIEANVPTDVTGGTLVAKPITDSHGNLYVLFATTTQPQNVSGATQGQPSGTFSQLYLAVSKDKCQSFTDYTVYDGSAHGTNSVQFGDIFNNLAIDGAGNLYVVGAGYIGQTAYASNAEVYMFHSTDQGQHWSAPVEVDPAPPAAHMLPAAVGGPYAGQLAIGYYRTTNGVTDPNATTGQWTYSTAETGNATAASPTFTLADVNPGFTYHHGDICNQGILCGAGPGGSDRSLLDFTAAAIDSHGCPLFTFAGNPTGAPDNNPASVTFNYVTRQTTGCFTASSSSGAGSSPAKPKPRRPAARRRRRRPAAHPRRHHRAPRHHRAARPDPDRDHDNDAGGRV